jgi:hypothetical protein
MINLDVLNEWLPLIISVLALSLSLYGLWWLQGRRGRLIVIPPRAFKSLETEAKIIVELPLAFFNDGAAAMVVANLILLAQQEKVRMLFRFEYTRDELDAEEHHWATPLALAGRQALMKVFSFHATKGETNLSAGNWDCTLLARLDHAADYRGIARFKLNVSRLSNSFSAIDNTSNEYQEMVKRYTPTKK